ncbi:MAG: hypothetical protein IBGAMO2_580069 [Arenicellales bacterium IbO2]|nr:MAG: hypothetical protein IBGAMO2_580069 [Arenicellales bacterium IbO2]
MQPIFSNNCPTTCDITAWLAQVCVGMTIGSAEPQSCARAAGAGSMPSASSSAHAPVRKLPNNRKTPRGVIAARAKIRGEMWLVLRIAPWSLLGALSGGNTLGAPL